MLRDSIMNENEDYHMNYLAGKIAGIAIESFSVCMRACRMI